jgi:hypothetical protein
MSQIRGAPAHDKAEHHFIRRLIFRVPRVLHECLFKQSSSSLQQIGRRFSNLTIAATLDRE